MRTRTIVGLLLVAGWWFARGDGGSDDGGADRAPAPTARPQAAVLPDGFAVLVGPRGGDARRVVALDRAAVRRHEMPLRLDREVRLVGTRTRAAVGWQDGARVKVGFLDTDGNPENISTWGKQVTRLCDGAATNEHRFAVGWLESDGRVWIVHGPAAPASAAGVEAPTAFTTLAAPTAKVTWCGVASAERNVALLWRDGNQWYMNFCDAKRCSGFTVGLPIDKADTLLGYGCIADSCLFATRDRDGATKLTRVTGRGKATTRPLAHARADTAVTIVGAGTRAFAVAYTADDGRTTVRRLTVDGAFTAVWHFENAGDAPGLAWAAGTLLVALPPDRMYALDMPK